MADNVSVWVPVISTLAGGVLAGGVALLVSRMNHRYAREREEKAAAQKLQHDREAEQDEIERERYFLATELVFLLEKFGEECVPPATDYGDVEDERGLSIAASHIPEISFSAISGDWRSLPPPLMYRLRELEVMLVESHNAMKAVYEDDAAPHFIEYFFRRRQHAVRLGIRAFSLATRLRKLCQMPNMKRAANRWSAPEYLWVEYREQKKILADCRRSGMTLEYQIIKSVHDKQAQYLI